MTASKGSASHSNTSFSDPGLGLDVLALEFGYQLPHTTEFEVEREDTSDECGFRGMWYELACFEIVSERNRTTHPHSLLLRGRDLVPNPLSCDL